MKSKGSGRNSLTLKDPFPSAPSRGLRERTKWIETQLENQTLVQMARRACIDHVTLTGQAWFQFFSEIIMKLMPYKP